MRTRPASALIALAVAMAALAACQTPSARGDDRADRLSKREGMTSPVLDRAGILGTDERRRIEQRLMRIDDETTVQIVVLAVASLGDETIESVASREFARIGIGKSSVNNGVLILVAPNDRSVRVEVGLGMEWEIDDDRAAEAVNAMLPHFREARYGAGIDVALDLLEPAATAPSWMIEHNDFDSVLRDSSSVGSIASLEGELIAIDDSTARMRTSGTEISLRLPPHWHGAGHRLSPGDAITAVARIRAIDPPTLELLNLSQ